MPAQFTFHLTDFSEHVRREVTRRLYIAAEEVKNKVQRNISKGRPASKPGEYPHADSGRLRNSIFHQVDPAKLSAIVGTNLEYGLHLEFGVAGGREIKPQRARALSWIDRETGQRVFARRVIQGPIAPRPFLRRTLAEMFPRLKTIFTAPMKDMGSPAGRISLSET